MTTGIFFNWGVEVGATKPVEWELKRYYKLTTSLLKVGRDKVQNPDSRLYRGLTKNIRQKP